MPTLLLKESFEKLGRGGRGEELTSVPATGA